MVSVGSKFPEDIQLKYIPYEKENDSILACSIPIGYDLAKKLPNKKVVFVSVPGAFTPTCTENHIPPYIAKASEFKAKGVEQIVVLSANDPFVLSAWGKALGAKDNFVIFASDPNAALSKKLGLEVDLSAVGFGLRTSRYAAIVDNGEIKYLEQEPAKGVTVSGADAILKAL